MTITEAKREPWVIRVCEHGNQLAFVHALNRSVHANTSPLQVCDAPVETQRAVEVVAASSMPSIGDMLREFHDAFELGNPDEVLRAMPPELTALRLRLHAEEYEELQEATWPFAPDVHTGHAQQDMLDLMKEACDLIYVGAGSLVSLGVDPETAMALVHASNMTKLHTCETCHGEGEVEHGTRRDEFGNWDTETFRCGDCDGTGKVLVKDEGGKVVKPDTYEPPNLEGLLK